MILNNIIPLVSSWLPMLDYALYFILGLCFVATVPYLLRGLFR